MLRGMIDHLTLDIILDFNHAVLIDTYPGFVLRSVLGWQLKRMHCAMRDMQCDSCPFSTTCAYAFIFESPITKTTASLQGRDRASHPFRIWTDAIPGSITKRIEFHVTLFGRAREYVPHIVYAFREAATGGLFKARTPAFLSSVSVVDREILNGERLLVHDLPYMQLGMDSRSEEVLEKRAIVHCHTPVRFKNDGRYSIDFSGSSFLNSCLRRVFTMLEQYGELNTGARDALIDALKLGHASEEPQVKDRSLRWVEFQHYSGRQKEAMMLGGVIGSFHLEGIAPRIAWQALDFCTVLGAGKNCSFGYGNIEVAYLLE